MAVARDAVTESATFTADTTFTHTPVGTPKGVLVYIAQNGSATDQVDSVTYGGVALTRVQFAADATTEPMASYAYFVGSGIPTGAQTVAINETGGTTKLAFVITLTASADTAVEASGIAQDDQANPSVTLATGAGVNTYVSGLLMSGLGTVGGITAGANGTTRGSNDFGQQVCYLADRDTNGTGGNVVFDLVATSDDVALVATAIKEAAGGGATITGAAAATFTASITTVGFRTRLGAAAQTITAGITTSGTRKTFGVVSRTFTLSITTSSGAPVITGAVSRTFALGISTVGTRKTFGASARTFTAGITTVGFRTRFGLSQRTITAGITTVGRRTRFGVVSRTIVFGATTTPSSVTFAGSVSFNIAVGIATVGRRGKSILLVPTNDSSITFDPKEPGTLP